MWQAGTCHTPVPKLQRPCAGPGCRQGESQVQAGARQHSPSTGTAWGLVPESRVGFACSSPCHGCQRLARCLAFKSPIQSTKGVFAVLEQEMFLWQGGLV